MPNPLAPEAPAAEPVADNPAQTPAPEAQPNQDGFNFHQFINETGAFNSDAWEKFPVQEGEDVSKFRNLGAKTPDVQTLARNYLNLERLLSTEKIPMPKPDAAPEEWDRVYEALGRPQEPKYEVSEGIEIPEETKTALDEAFHKAGITQRQADRLFAQTAEILEQSQAVQAEQTSMNVEAAISSLEQEVGPRNSEQYKQALDRAEVVAEHLGLSDESLFAIPGFASKMAALHDKLIESNFKSESNTVIRKAQSIQEEINSIMSNPNDPRYHDYRASDWNSTQEYVVNLYKQLEEAQQS